MDCALAESQGDSRLGVAVFACRGELGADLFCFGSPEAGVKGEGLLPVVARQAGVPDSTVGAGEAVMSTSLLGLVADLAGQVERGGVLGAGRAGPLGGEEDFAESVERLGLTGPVADLPVQGQGLLMVAGGLLIAGQSQVDVAEVGQGVNFTPSVADLAGQGQGLLEVAGGLLMGARPHARTAEVAQGVRFNRPVADLAG